MTHEQQTHPEDTPDPTAGDGAPPLDAEEHEPDIEPFAGDDDILSGHLGTDA